jgi:outer membrane protein TolC
MTRSLTLGLAVWAALGFSAPFCILAPAVSQEAAPLSLAEAADLARRNSLAVATSRQQLEAARADRGVTQSQGLPTVNLTSSINYNRIPGLSGGAGLGGLSSLTIFPANGLYAQNQISGSWTIFDAFASRDALKISDHTIRLDELAIVQAEQDAMLNAAVAYFDVLQAEALTAANAEAVQRAREQLVLGEARYKQDLLTRADLLQLRSQLGNALNAFAQAQNRVAIARMTFSNNVNAPVGERPLVANPSLPGVTMAPAAALEQALALRAEVLQASAREAIDRTRVELQGKASYPTVALTSSYSQRNLDEGQMSAALQMSWNVFDGFKVRNQVLSAASQAEASHLALEQSRQKVALEVRQALQTYANANAQVTNTQETLASAQEAYRLGLARYRLDLITQFALADIANTLTQAQYNQATAVNDRRVALVRLARAVGYDLSQILANAR